MRTYEIELMTDDEMTEQDGVQWWAAQLKDRHSETFVTGRSPAEALVKLVDESVEPAGDGV